MAGHAGVVLRGGEHYKGILEALARGNTIGLSILSLAVRFVQPPGAALRVTFCNTIPCELALSLFQLIFDF